MEKFYHHREESFCDSDTDSAQGANDFLYQLIFGKINKGMEEM